MSQCYTPNTPHQIMWMWSVNTKFILVAHDNTIMIQCVPVLTWSDALSAVFFAETQTTDAHFASVMR